MRHFVSDSAESYSVGAVEVVRWEQYGLGDRLPFQAMWYTVPPGARSPLDRHPETELSVVISGTAWVETGDEVTEVAAGSCFLLDSEEAHVIGNRSADVPLRVFTTYWMPRTGPTVIPIPVESTVTPTPPAPIEPAMRNDSAAEPEAAR